MEKLLPMIDRLAHGKAYDDREVGQLQNRLRLLWGPTPTANSMTASIRKKNARNMYTRIQAASEHLLLPFVMSYCPTACSAKNGIKEQLDRIVQEALRNPQCCELSEEMRTCVIAGVQHLGLDEHPGFIAWYKALFAIVPDPGRAIQSPTHFMFSRTPLEKILRIQGVSEHPQISDISMRLPLVQTSKMWQKERGEGLDYTNCVTLIISDHDEEDATVSFRISYEAAYAMREDLQMQRISHF